MTPKPQPLPPCVRFPRRKCPGACQYVLPAGACLHALQQLEPDG